MPKDLVAPLCNKSIDRIAEKPGDPQESFEQNPRQAQVAENGEDGAGTVGEGLALADIDDGVKVVGHARHEALGGGAAEGGEGEGLVAIDFQ